MDQNLVDLRLAGFFIEVCDLKTPFLVKRKMSNDFTFMPLALLLRTDCFVLDTVLSLSSFNNLSLGVLSMNMNIG
jgi:hypothetical protein